MKTRKKKKKYREKERKRKKRRGRGMKENEKTEKKRHVRKKGGKKVTRFVGRQSREAYDGSQNGRNRNVYPSNVKAITCLSRQQQQ